MPLPPVQTGYLGNISNRTTICLRRTVYRTSRSHAIQVRTFWWWGRQGESSLDEHLEERLRRHQKIMRSRYSKVVRRRALWDRDDNPHWPWHMSGRSWGGRFCGSKPLSSAKGSEVSETRDDHDPNVPPPPSGLHETLHKDFESFRAAVDRALARDPYGTLFGRRLESPPSSNNSSWTSFSWMYHPKWLREDGIQESKPNQRPESPPKNSSTTPVPERSPSNQGEEDYEYDPISMRKVLVKKSPEEHELRKHSQETPFLGNGVDIPVKTYDSHKIHGFEGAEREPDQSKPEDTPITSSDGLNRSNGQGLHNLMSRAQGITDTDRTSLLSQTPSRHNVQEDDGGSGAFKKICEPSRPDDDVPLFSGTTYEGRCSEEKRPIETDWLAKEGFRPQTSKSPRPNIAEAQTIETASEKTADKLQPALDRVQPDDVQSPDADPVKLQPSLDRRFSAKKGLDATEKDSEAKRGLAQPIPATEEDIDLLRASDVRAATRAARVTRQESQKMKKNTRTKLEADFAARLNEETGFDEMSNKAEGPTSKLTRSLNNVWDHIREYPNGIVAKTIKSVDAFNSNYMKYIRPEKEKDLTDKLVFQDKLLSKTPSIYKRTSKASSWGPFTPSHEVVNAQQERLHRTTNLREASEKAREETAAYKAQLSQLSTDIQSIYESEYGPINAEHRQPVSCSTDLDSGAATSNPADVVKSHPLSSASIKPGVSTSPVIDKHVSEFEPEFSLLVDRAKQVRIRVREAAQHLKLIKRARDLSLDLESVMDGTKEVRRELHEAKQAIRALETGRPATIWNAPHTYCSSFGNKRIDLKVQENSEITATTLQNSIREVPSIQSSNTALHEAPLETVEPMRVPEPIFTPAGSPVWNDEQPPSVESLRTKKFDSPYIILAYDSLSGKVDLSPMNEPAKASSRSADIVGILGRLKNAPEFLKHFTTLKRAGYSLFNGSEDLLIFKKTQNDPVSGVAPSKEANESPAAVKTGMPFDQPAKEAATVLNELPTGINPVPGPAAPTAPPSRPFGNHGSQSKVRRQESVFSGTIRPNAASLSAPSGDDKPSTPQPNAADSKGPQDSLWRRFTRGIRRTVLTIVAIGGGAYVIGFVAEGLRARAQTENGIDAQAQGPRKRIVMNGQRSGIFSTESSR